MRHQDLTTPPPEQAARDSYEVMTQLFPQRHAPWEQLAEWERTRWRLVTAAARVAPAQEESKLPS